MRSCLRILFFTRFTEQRLFMNNIVFIKQSY